MRYPVGNTGSKEEYERDWYNAQTFGNETRYGYHEGVDINLKTGGDTDLGKELKAIASGEIVYYHYSSHPTSGFGRHLVIKIDGAWGTRWAHYAHCDTLDFINKAQLVSEGQIIARLGKSGTSYAHLHFSLYKVDPATLGGIDKYAKTQEDLNKYWEDPIAFINKWINAPTEPQHPTAPLCSDQSKYDFGLPWGIMEMQATKSVLNAQKDEIGKLNNKIENAQRELA
jgi:murein DD-endopeptidase MepM/ murein hydrolase activator NlpD